MIAIDTNVLVYAHRTESSYSERAYDLIASLAEGSSPWAIPMHCLHEFVAIVSNPKIWAVPSSPAQIGHQVAAWLGSPSFVPVLENRASVDILMRMLAASPIRGGMVHDARIVAACQAAGVKELLSVDRDFSRFAGFNTRNPFH
jgi:uncharacterized protein